jgi:hypothetical protein
MDSVPPTQAFWNVVSEKRFNFSAQDFITVASIVEKCRTFGGLALESGSKDDVYFVHDLRGDAEEIKKRKPARA